MEWVTRSSDLKALDFFMRSLKDYQSIKFKQHSWMIYIYITPEILQNVRERFEQNFYY